MCRIEMPALALYFLIVFFDNGISTSETLAVAKIASPPKKSYRNNGLFCGRHCDQASALEKQSVFRRIVERLLRLCLPRNDGEDVERFLSSFEMTRSGEIASPPKKSYRNNGLFCGRHCDQASALEKQSVFRRIVERLLRSCLPRNDVFKLIFYGSSMPALGIAVKILL